MHLIECGSSSLTPTQQSYATIEIESLAVQWALLRSKFYLHGLQSFEVWTDHKPLQGVFAKELHRLEKTPPDENERENRSFQLKFSLVHAIASKVSQGVVALANLLDRVVHIKTDSRFGGEVESEDLDRFSTDNGISLPFIEES